MPQRPAPPVFDPPALAAAVQPSAHGSAALERVRAFIADHALPAVSDFARRHGDVTFALESDGRMGTALLELKRLMQRSSAEAGLYAPHLPVDEGGLGLGLVDCFYLQEEVYRHGLDGVQWMLAWTDGPSHLVRNWSPAARDEHLPDVLAGRKNVAFALTEPGVGSDFPSLTTAARRLDDGSWELDGTKHLITGAPQAELAQVFTRVDGAERGRLTSFLVPLDADGVTRGTVQQTIMADGQTGPIVLDRVRLPDTSLVGAEGEAMGDALVWINWTRTRRGGMCSGLALHCLQRSIDHARRRKAFDRPIIGFGAVEQMISDMYMDWVAMRALSLELLARLDKVELLTGRVPPAARRDVSVLKTFNDEALYRVADRALQVHGGLGLLTAAGLEKIFRVARNLRIPAGTTEIQRAAIAQAIAGHGL